MISTTKQTDISLPSQYAPGFHDEMRGALVRARTPRLRSYIEFAEAEEPAEYRAQIDRLLSDGKLRREMGLAARKRVVKQYAWEAHLSLIPDLLGDPIGKETRGVK